MSKRILIIGASGLVGSTLAEYVADDFDLYLVNNQTPFSFRNFPIANIDLLKNREAIITLIKEYKPNYVVHTAAYPSVDFCEANQHLAKALHVDVTHDIVKVCNNIGSKVIYFSSDAVFDGQISRKYTENDPPNPLSYYGKTKLEAEKIVLKTNSNIILRTTVIYGWHSHSRFTNFVLDSLRNLKKVTAFTDQYNTPTLADDLAKAILRILDKDITGLYHAVGNTCISRYQFALKIAKKFGFDENLIIPTNSLEKGQVAPRPPNGCLENKKLQKKIEFTFVDIDEGIDVLYQKSKRKI